MKALEQMETVRLKNSLTGSGKRRMTHREEVQARKSNHKNPKQRSRKTELPGQRTRTEEFSNISHKNPAGLQFQNKSQAENQPRPIVTKDCQGDRSVAITTDIHPQLSRLSRPGEIDEVDHSRNGNQQSCEHMQEKKTINIMRGQ